MNGQRHIHILGICGTAMAAIAALAKESGFTVTGSDAGIYPPMSDYLESLAIDVQPFSPDNLDPVPDLCVIGNAMSRGNVEVEAILDRGLAYCSGPEFVGDHILPGRHAVVVAGTHGKTSTSSIVAHLLAVAGRDPGFLIGGIPENFGGGARLATGEPFVLEGDEYDTAFFDKRSKFLHYHARTLILNNLEYDHADIFPDLESIKLQFSHLLRTVPASGNVIVNADDENIADVLARGCWTPLTFFAQKGHTHAEWQWQADSDHGGAFTIFRNNEKFLNCRWSMLGIHNVANACAATAAAALLGLSADSIKTGFESFGGIRRRMTLVGEAGGVRIFDDFAHHPTAIAGIVSAAKAAMKSGGRLRVVIEPRSNTMRTKIHQGRLASCFIGADEVIFVPASNRNLQADEVLDTDAVCRAIGNHARTLPDADAIIEYLATGSKRGDDILILSNGGFDNIHARLLKRLDSGDLK